jgi:uncharacterized protein (TIGR03067 family)
MRVLVVALVCFLMGAGGAKEAKQKEMERLEGNWTMKAGEHNGQPVPDALLAVFKRTARDGVTTIRLEGRVVMKARFTIDPTKKPKTIDYDMLDGPKESPPQLGIYEVNGNRVRFCFAPPGAERPADFTAKKGTGRVFSEWQRDK